jgi:hypothetical protein
VTAPAKTPKNNILSRRNLLIGGGLGLGTLALAGRDMFLPSGLETSVVTVIKRMFGANVAPEPVLRQFAQFYLAERAKSDFPLSKARQMMMRSYSAFGWAYDGLAAVGVTGIAGRVSTLHNEIGQSFVRNTNMAYREADEPVEFVEWALVPYACNNRMARFDYDD